MATVLGLAMKISADASGVQKALTPVQRAFQQLDAEAAKVTDVFKQFEGASAGAGAAQQKFATDLAFLNSALRTGQVDAKQYAEEFAILEKEAKATADAFAEGARLTEANRTAEEKRVSTLQRLDELLQLGAINQETFNRASAEASGANAAAAEAAQAAAATQADADRQRAADATRAASIIEANMTREERAQREFQQSTAELNRLRAAGLLTENDYAAALRRVSGDYSRATLAADRYGQAASNAGRGGTLQFNELSGILSALPGPIGNVAGRLSGLSSASEGLSRIFSGGLTQGLSGIGTTLAGLVNPFTVAIAGFTGVATAAVSVVSGLSQLEAETERLTNAAEKMGVSFGFIQTLEQAAKMAGIEFGSVNSAMTKLLKTLAGADEESKQATAALGRLGVSLADLDGMDSEQQIRLIGERLQGIEDPAKRAAAATAIFGKSGAELLPFFNNLGIAEQTLTRFNAKLSDIDATRVLALGDSFDGVQASLTGLGRELLTPFIGISQSIADGLAPAIATFGRNIGAILDILSPLTSALGLVINNVLQLGSVFGNVIGTALEPFAAQGRTISSVIDAMSQVITRVFGAVNDAVISFREFFQFERIAASFRDTLAQIGEVVDRIATIAQVAFGKFVGVVSEAFGSTVEYVTSTVDSFLQFVGLGDSLTAIGSTISSVFGSISSVFSTIADAIGGTVGRLLTMAENFLGIERSAEQASAGIDKTAESVKTLTKDEQKAFDELTKAIEAGDKALDTAINKAGEFGQAGFDAAYEFQQALQDLQEQANEGELNAEQYARGVANATAEYENQIDAIRQVTEETKKAADEAAKKAEADKKRIEELLNPNDAASKVQSDIAFAIEQQAAAEKELAAARSAGDAESANAAAARLAQLDGLRTKLEEQAQAIDQGFADGFSKAFEKTAESVSGLVDKAAQFGNAGAEAAMRLQEGIAAAQEQARDGIISQEVYDREVASQRRVFEERIAGIEEARKREQEAAKEVFDQQVAANERVNQFIGQQAQAEIAAAEEAAARREQAAFNIEAIEQRIALERQSLEAAREQNDTNAARAAVQRIDALREALTVEQQIADGRAAELQKQQDLIASQQQFQQQQLAQAQEYNQQQQKAQEAYAQQQAKVFEEQQKAAAAEAARQEERLAKLNTLGAQTIKTQDVRTVEGANLVLQLAANAQDPALIQQRLQTKLLERINSGIAQAAGNYFNQPVAIVGAGRLN